MRDYAACYPEELSGGMRQRVAICRALIHEPPLLLMDEPFGALDALTREKLNLDLIRLTAQSRQTVVFVTHSIDEAVLMSDRIVVMTPSPGSIFHTLRVAFDGHAHHRHARRAALRRARQGDPRRVPPDGRHLKAREGSAA